MNIEDLLTDTNKDRNLNNLDIFKITNAFVNNSLEQLKFDLSSNEIIESIRNQILKVEVVHTPSTNINTMLLKVTNAKDKFFIVSNPLKNDFYINKFNQKDSFIYAQSVHLESSAIKNKKEHKIDKIVLNYTLSEVYAETNAKTELFNHLITFDITKRELQIINNFKEGTLYEDIAFAIENKTQISEGFLELLELKYDIMDLYVKNIIINDLDSKKNNLNILDLANNINKISSIKKNEKQKRVI